MEFSNLLIYWYLHNKRDLPWRNTQEPYHIWLSEIMLQQTRIEQGLPYYYKFTEAFPTVFHLAEASTEKVLKLWQGLGYYSRARNLHETAKYVAYTLDGVFPDNYIDLKRLKGVGDYTASAIASICFNEPVAVVDGNVYRVLSRVFGIEIPINSSEGIKKFKALASDLIDVNEPATFNQAIMEFGALHCKPKNPLCDTCPFNDRCEALKSNRIQELPVKLKKTKVKTRYLNYLVFNMEGNTTVLEKRTGKGIWQGLYQFPLIETEKPVSHKELIRTEEFQEKMKDTGYELQLFNEIPVIHKLSHQHLHTRFWVVESKIESAKTVSLENILDYPVPVLIENFLNEYLSEDYK